MAKLVFLGTGTSSGVPVIGCDCDVCRSKDPKDSRLRSSAFVETDNGTKILIDCGADFREQALRADIRWIDAILITHSHQDHIGGIDELRQLNFVMKKSIPIYGTTLSVNEIKKRFDYIFKKTQEGGGKPKIDLFKIKKNLSIGENQIIPIPVFHGKIPILGFRFGTLAYITDASSIPEKSMELLKGVKILIINALRNEPHPTHFSLSEAIETSKKIGPEKTYFIHMTHQYNQNRDNEKLPAGFNFAYDRQEIFY